MYNCPVCNHGFPEMNLPGEDHIRNYSVITCPRCKAKLRLIEEGRRENPLITAAVVVLIWGITAIALSTVSKTAAVILLPAVLIRFCLKMKKNGMSGDSREVQLEVIPDEEPFSPSGYRRGRA